MNGAAAHRAYRWPVAGACLGAVLLALLVSYWSSWEALVGVWLESATYSHGLLVFPAVVYLAWINRTRLQGVQPRAYWPGLVLLVGTLAMWYVARIGAVQVVEQFAIVGAVAAAVLVTLGPRVARVLAFPLLFMFFAVPVGDFFIPKLMEFTAWFVVRGVALSGIPVYQDGFMISIPRGDFEVAKACSGIRYLIASVTLGTLFAYLTFNSLKRRVAFVLLSALLPIVANGLRAYGIVMIAHWSNLKYAIGVDHLIYGWLFFGVVMFFLFWIGMRFRDEPPVVDAAPVSVTGARPASGGKGVALAAAAIAAIGVAPWLHAQARAGAGGTISPAALPRAAGPWSGPTAVADPYWPAFEDYDDRQAAIYRRGDAQVDVAIVSYTGADNELIHVRNVMVRGARTRVLSRQDYTVTIDGETWPLSLSRIWNAGSRRDVVHWYQVGAARTQSDGVAKLREWMSRLGGRPQRRVLVTASMPAIESDGRPEALDAFLAVHGPLLVECVVTPDAPVCVRLESAP